jgi:hypothetical protein
MTAHSNGEHEMVFYYTNFNRFGAVYAMVVFNWVAISCLWFLFMWVIWPPRTMIPRVLTGVLLFLVSWLFTWMAALATVLLSRSIRGRWWVRLTTTGFAVNDRVLAPRRYGWHEINQFMLVAPANEIGAAIVGPPKTFIERLTGGRGQRPTLRVGFECTPGHRPLASRLPGGMVSKDGIRAHGLIIGHWGDRHLFEVVDLLNDWLALYRQAE